MTHTTRRRPLPALILLATLLATPTALASDPLETTLAYWPTATQMEATGALIDLDLEANPWFHLQAESVQVETDARSIHTTILRTDPETTTATQDNALVQGTTARPGGHLHVQAPDARVLLEADHQGCASARAPLVATNSYNPRLAGRAPLRTSLDDALQWTPCGDGTVTLHGDLLLVLWEWDARIQSDQADDTLQSGQEDPADGGTGARELFLYAHNATLQLPAGTPTVYLHDLEVSAPAAILEDARGRWKEHPVAGELELEGDLGLSLQGNGPTAPLHAAVTGARTARLDGTTLAALPAPTSPPWAPAGLMLGLVAIAGLAYARPHLHYLHNERTGGELGSLVPKTRGQRRGVGLWIMARRAERGGRFRTSLRRADRANRLFRPFPEAQFTRAVAAGRLGQHADAMTDFLDLYNRHDEPMGRAAAACGIAQECCRLERWENGKEWLLVATTESFPYTHEASQEPEFDHYAGEPWFDALRRGRDLPTSFTIPGGADPSVH